MSPGGEPVLRVIHRYRLPLSGQTDRHRVGLRFMILTCDAP